MNLEEYNKVKDYSYKHYCDYLKDKYGAVPGDYGKAINKRLGYFIHHIGEDQIAHLSDRTTAKENDHKFQEPEMLVYADYLEHLLLHIMIGRETAGTSNLGLDGAQRFILPALRNYFRFGIVHPTWGKEYYQYVENDKDVFEILFKEYNKLIEDIDCLLDTNIVLYEQLYQTLEEKNKALVVLGTGLGKTSTALQYVKDKKCRALVLGPNNTIVGDDNSGWLKYPEVDAMTYQAFANVYSTINYNEYELIILDEAHHAGYDEGVDKGAKVWGKAIQYLFDNNIKVLGLTATPIRSDGIDLSETLFKDCTCEGYTIEEAIELGIIHPFSFITSIYDTDGIKSEIKAIKQKVDLNEPTTRKLVGHLDLVANNIPLVSETLHKYIDQTNIRRKGIIFVQTIDTDDKNNIESAKAIVKTSYPNAKFAELHSNLSQDKIDENRNWFIGDEDSDCDKYLIAVNMISEGAHYPGVNTLIMFRTTQSYLVYSQQLGRAITLIKDADPYTLVFDFVNNIENVSYNSRKVKEKRAYTKPTQEQKDLIQALQSTPEFASGQIVVQNECRDFVKSMKELKNYTGVNVDFQDWEIEMMYKYYPKEGVESCTKRINDKWGGEKRSCASIAYQVWFRGLITDAYLAKQWKEEELEILKTYYPTEGKEVYKRLPGRDKELCARKAYSLGVYQLPSWSIEDDNILKTYYPIEGKKCFKRLPHKSKDACQNRCTFLRLESNNRFWKEEEINILKEFYPEEGQKAFKRIPNRSAGCCQAKINELGIKNKRKWTDEETAILIKYYPTEGGEVYKRLPNKTKAHCGGKALRLGLRFIPYIGRGENKNA